MQICWQITKSIQQYNQKTMKLSQVPHPKEKSNRVHGDFKRQQDKSTSFNKLIYSKLIRA